MQPKEFSKNSWPIIIRIFAVLTILSVPGYGLRFKIWWFPLNPLEIGIYCTLAAILIQNPKQLLSGFSKIPPPFQLGIKLLFSGLLLSILFNPDVAKGLGILKSWFASPFLFGLGLAVLIRKESELRNFLRFSFLSGILASLIGLIYFFSQNLTYDGRLKAFFLSPNHLAMFLAPPFLIGMYFLILPENIRPAKKFFALGTILIAAVLGLTQSLATLTALALALAIVTLISPQIKRSRKILLAFIFLLFIFLAIQIFQPKIERYFDPQERTSFSSRLAIWQAAWKIAVDHPFWGIGPSNFQAFYLEYQKYFPPYPEWAVPLPHNLFFAFWLQTGILGLTGFGLIVFSCLKREWLQFSQSKKPLPLAGLFLAYLFYLLIHGLADTPYWKNDLAFYFWLFFFLSLKEFDFVNPPVNPVYEKEKIFVGRKK